MICENADRCKLNCTGHNVPHEPKTTCAHRGSVCPRCIPYVEKSCDNCGKDNPCSRACGWDCWTPKKQEDKMKKCGNKECDYYSSEINCTNFRADRMKEYCKKFKPVEKVLRIKIDFNKLESAEFKLEGGGTHFFLKSPCLPNENELFKVEIIEKE
jgi:hypothetical protein